MMNFFYQIMNDEHKNDIYLSLILIDWCFEKRKFVLFWLKKIKNKNLTMNINSEWFNLKLHDQNIGIIIIEIF